MVRLRRSRTQSTRHVARRMRGPLAIVIAAACVTGLAACGGSAQAGTPTLIWYTNPDGGGQATLAQECSTDEYTITTQRLPQDASQQRIQLARRLAAHDQAIDLMSLDPPFIAEFANAGFLAKLPADVQQTLTDQSFDGAVAAATWNGELVAFPFWANTQVLWYRKSFVERAGLDMSQPVTWDQIIDAAVANGGKIGVQANKYEGYVVWINALIAGAGGSIVSDVEKGADATLSIDSDAGRIAAGIIEKLAHSTAAPPDMSVSNEGTAGATFGDDDGAFLVNWTYIFHNYDSTAPDVASDIGYAMYPQSVAGQDARPPFGGIAIGVNSFSAHSDLAIKAASCIVSPEHQGEYAAAEGNMPASAEGYAYPKLAELYPADLLQLFQDSVDAAAPRTVTPYWSDISSSIQSTWHPPISVNQDTPKRSADFIRRVLQGGALL